MKTFTLTIQIKVTNNWIDDGFDPHTPEWKESICNSIRELLPYAYDNEFIVTIKQVKP